MSKSNQPASEIEALRTEMSELKESLNYLTQILINKTQPTTTQNKPQLKIFIGHGDSDRKPFEFSISGVITSSFSASPVRSAIFLTLLLDLKTRSETQNGLGNLELLTPEVLAGLEAEGSDRESSDNKIRVAAYRFFDFCEGKSVLSGKDYSLAFDHDSYQLNLKPTSTQNSASSTDGLELDISTNLPEVFRIISKLSGRLTLNQVKNKKVVYVPSGKHGTDQLLLQMYDHPHKLHVTSLYLRPPFASYPPALLEKIGVSDLVKKRKDLAFAGYQEERFLFEEVLSLATINNITQRDAQGNFKFYPKNVTALDVIDHIKNLISILETYKNYNLYLSEIQVPFVLVNYEIQSGAVPENYLVFFQSNEDFSKKDMGCMVMSDPLAWRGVQENVVNWIKQHPSTVKERNDVIAVLQKTIEKLS